jgi:hypothetical protein
VPEPGPLAQEAALLTAVVREWLDAHGAAFPAGQAASDPAPGAAGDADENDDTDENDESDEQATDGNGSRGGGAGNPAGGRATARDFPWVVPPGATTCTGCPLCRLLSSLTGSRPEVLAHLLDAAGSLAAAARAAWSPAGPPGGPWGDRPRDDTARGTGWDPGWDGTPRDDEHDPAPGTARVRPDRGSADGGTAGHRDADPAEDAAGDRAGPADDRSAARERRGAATPRPRPARSRVQRIDIT